MTLFSDEEGYGIRLSREEWEALWNGKKLSRTTGSSQGYFRVNLEAHQISMEFLGE